MKTGQKHSAIMIIVFCAVVYCLDALIRIPVVHNAIAPSTPTATPYANIPVFGSSELPFYTPVANSAFVSVINFRGLTTWRYNWVNEEVYVPFLIDGDKLLFSGYFVEPDESKNDTFRELNSELLCININSGHVLWQDWIGMPNLVLDEKHVLYVPATRDFVPPGLVAYDTTSGRKLWETRFPHDMVDTDDFFLIGQDLYVSVHLGHGSYSSYIVNRETGEIKQAFEGQKRYVQDGTIISDGIVMKRYYYGYGPVQAFPFGEKSQLWIFPERVVSNIATDGSIAYFVTMGTQLVAINIQTGKVLARLQFMPEFDPVSFDYLNEAPTVAAGNGYVAVYFKDKKQLSVYRFIGSH